MFFYVPEQKNVDINFQKRSESVEYQRRINE